MLRCGNAGWSGWIDEFGGIRAVLTRTEDGRIQTTAGASADPGTIYFRGAATVSVTHDERWVGQNSFYVQHGEWFLLVSAGLALLTFLLLRMEPAVTTSWRRPEPID